MSDPRRRREEELERIKAECAEYYTGDALVAIEALLGHIAWQQQEQIAALEKVQERCAQIVEIGGTPPWDCADSEIIAGAIRKTKMDAPQAAPNCQCVNHPRYGVQVTGCPMHDSSMGDAPQATP